MTPREMEWFVVGIAVFLLLLMTTIGAALQWIFGVAAP